MDFSTIMEAAVSGVGGGLLGGIMGIGKKWITNRHEASMQSLKDIRDDKERDHDLAMADKEIERDMKAADAQLDQAKFEADSAALTTASASQDAEVTTLGPALSKCGKFVNGVAALAFTFVTFCQKMIRPVLTVVLVYQTFTMFNELSVAMGGLANLPIEDQAALLKHIVLSILGLTGIAVGFWYVARPEKANRSA
jgi:hypothetical protein